MADIMCRTFHLSISSITGSRDLSMGVTLTYPSTGAEDSRLKPPALHHAADTMYKAKLDRILHEMGEVEKEQGKSRSSFSGGHFQLTYFVQRSKNVRLQNLPSPVLEFENIICSFINSLVVETTFQALLRSMNLPPRCALARFPASLRRSTR